MTTARVAVGDVVHMIRALGEEFMNAARVAACALALTTPRTSHADFG